MRTLRPTRPLRVLLRHAEVHIDRVKGLQRYHRITRRQVLTEVDLTDTQDSRKRCPDRFPRNRGTDFPNLCLRLPLLCGCAVVLCPRNRALLHEVFQTFEVQTRKFAV